MRRLLPLLIILGIAKSIQAQQTQKPTLYGKNWMAITGRPLGADSGAQIFQKGGNAIDAACAMLASVCTQWAVLTWGGETQALIYNPHTGKVIAINALGFAPTGATVDFFKSKGMNFPPEYGPLAAVTPGTPGGLCYMLAEYGTMSLKEVLAPAMQLAAGFAIDAPTANSMEANKKMISQWPYSKAVFLPHAGEKRAAPEAGEIFVQKDLLGTLSKMVEAEQDALKHHKLARYIEGQIGVGQSPDAIEVVNKLLQSQQDNDSRQWQDLVEMYVSELPVPVTFNPPPMFPLFPLLQCSPVDASVVVKLHWCTINYRVSLCSFVISCCFGFFQIESLGRSSFLEVTLLPRLSTLESRKIEFQKWPAMLITVPLEVISRSNIT